MSGAGTTRIILRSSGTRQIIPGIPRGDTIFAVRADIFPVSIEWTEERVLTVRYPPGLLPANIVRQENHWKDVRIDYVVLANSN